MASTWNPFTHAFEVRDKSGPAPYLSATIHDSQPAPTRAASAAPAPRAKAPTPTAEQRQQAAEDELYKAFFGDDSADAAPAASSEEEALYEAFFGGDRA
ncbi:hypothetical protein [Microbacterium sp. EST19A]|uniref:hypothetical protein n=1 Tax=Microbacterium sp. EST19A TaxID=2862681 RepID=UPI001CBAB47A|nr:hypothetical protein [Microbacterium sp. EST19A]